jgi:thiamine biosynthesis lipoprotein ApbE
MDESKNSIRFLQHDASLDFGGIGKGMALDEVSAMLDEMGIKNAFISFGGSSILTRGHHPHGNYWPFSFQNPTIGQEIWKLNNDAISVSCAEQGLEKNAHILNPKSGRWPEKITTGVQSDNVTDAEVLSTTLVAAPPEKHQEIAGRFNVKKWAVFDAIVH